MSKQTFEKKSFFFLLRGLQGLRLFFSHILKYNPYLITLKFGTDKQHIKDKSPY